MNMDFLERLSLTAEEKEKISRLGVSNAAALLSLVQAAPGEFKAYFGGQRSQELAVMLEEAISASERKILATPSDRNLAAGAILRQTPPVLRPPDYDLQTRDHLFEQLQQLRQSGDSSPETLQRIAQLEESLNALLEKAPGAP